MANPLADALQAQQAQAELLNKLAGNSRLPYLANSDLDLRKYQSFGVDPATFGNRPSGEAKGTGYLGVLQRPAGGVSTELSIGVNLNGKETEIPLMVPTLNQKELDWLMTNEPKPSALPESIKRKAIDHARMRMQQGQSPFAGE